MALIPPPVIRDDSAINDNTCKTSPNSTTLARVCKYLTEPGSREGGRLRDGLTGRDGMLIL